VAELLRERLALILLHKCADPRMQEITLTRVEMSRDLKQAKVFYAARAQVDETQVRQALERALGFIKQEVARENLFRFMPEIIFLADMGLEAAERLAQLLHEAGMSNKSGQSSKD